MNPNFEGYKLSLDKIQSAKEMALNLELMMSIFVKNVYILSLQKCTVFHIFAHILSFLHPNFGDFCWPTKIISFLNVAFFQAKVSLARIFA